MNSNLNQGNPEQSPSVGLVTMTPEWARELLNKNPRNRSLNRGRVQSYAEDMRRGFWQLSPEPIALDTDGVILNGQHRLTAVVEAGLPVKMLLGTDFRPECFSVIDTGAARSMSDIITIRHKAGHGLGDNYNPITCASVVRVVLFAENCPESVWTGPGVNKLATKAIMLREFEASESEYRHATRIATSVHNKFKYISRPALGALIVLAVRQNYHDVEGYADTLGTGEGLRKGSPILAFRSFLMNTASPVFVRKQAQAHLAALIKNFRQWREGVEITQFKSPCVTPLPRLKGR